MATQGEGWRTPIPRTAYIFCSFKRPEEIDTLREILGRSFFLVAAHSPLRTRVASLTERIEASDYVSAEQPALARAQQLVARDEQEVNHPFGQRLTLTFPKADVFVDVSDQEKGVEALRRFIYLLFGHPFKTPKKDELAMFLAQGAALRSSDLSRQIGAVIATEDGETVCIGTNEVPKAGGGLYWEGDDPDHRDWKVGFSSSEKYRRRAIGQLLANLRDHDLLKPEVVEEIEKDPDRMEQVISDVESHLEGTDLMNITEFGRAVHAEMAALMSAARRGIAIDEATLYTTTFPCHVCARHAIAAGIRRVVYNEPYPKSLAFGLHGDALVRDERSWESQVSLEAFVGLAPWAFIDLFTMTKRKDRDGIVHWEDSRKTAIPRISEPPPSYLERVVTSADELAGLLEKADISAHGKADLGIEEQPSASPPKRKEA